MIIESHRMDLLKKYILMWKESGKLSRGTIGTEIGEAIDRFNKVGHYAEIGIHFRTNGDACSDGDANQQNLYRWLGVLNDGQYVSEKKIFDLEPMIVAAMPEKIRNAYINAIYFDADFTVVVTSKDESPCMDHLAQTLVKEGSEATLAVLALKDSPADRHNALVELKESAAATQAAISAIEKMDCPLKAVEA